MRLSILPTLSLNLQAVGQSLSSFKRLSQKKCGILVVIDRNLAENIASIDPAKFEQVPYPIEYKRQQTLVQTVEQLELCTSLSALELAWKTQVWQSYTHIFEQSFHSFWNQFPLEQHELTERLNQFVIGETNIEAALMYGSLGANKVALDSDIDYFIQSSLHVSYWLDVFQKYFGAIHADLLGNKITLRFKTTLLVEIVVGKLLSEIELYYRESLIHNCDFTLVKGNVEHREQLISFTNKQVPTHVSVASIASELYFLFCSLPKLVRLGDAYKYSFHVMIIRHYAVQLEHLLLGNSEHNYLPKQAAVTLPDFPWDSFETPPISIDSNQYCSLYRYVKGLFQRLEKAGLLEVDKYFSKKTELLHHIE